MPARARRSVAPEEDPRIRRQDWRVLSACRRTHMLGACWMFLDLHYENALEWLKFDTLTLVELLVERIRAEIGWTTRPGPELGYDHYYIKPGKNTKCDVEGEDYFYGEAAIVAYGMKEKIFGEMPVEQQVPRISMPRRGNPAARAAKRGSVSGSPCNSDSDDDDDDASVSSSAKRRLATTTRKRRQQETQRRSSSPSSQQKQKRRRRPGGHALDAISITSGSVGSGDDSKSTSTMDLESSDDDESDADFRVDGVDDEEEDEDDDSDDDSDGDSDDDEFNINSEEDPNEDDIVVVNVGILASKLKGNFQAKKREPRPLLSTGTKKRKVGDSKSELKQKNATNEKSAKRSRSYSAGAGTSEGRRMKSEPKRSGRSSQSTSVSKPSAPTSAFSGKNKRKPAEPRRLSVETEPPSQPTTSQPTSQSTTPSAAPIRAAAAPTRASTAAPNPRHSFLSPSTPLQLTEKSRKQREVTTSTRGSQIYVESSGEIAPIESDNTSFEPDPPDFDDHSFEQPAPTSAEESTTRINSHPGPTSSASHLPVKSSPAHHPPNRVVTDAVREDPTPFPTTTSSTAVPPASSPVSVHLQLDEVLFPSQPNQTFRVKISSTESPKQTRISIEHVQTREQRECIFSDIRQLDGKMTHEVPEKAIFEALLRCLRSLQSASATAGDEAQHEKFSTEELGKVDLLHVNSNVLCLQLMFPCYEFWQQKHRFMLKLIPAQARLKALVRELEEARRELVVTQERLDSALSRNQLIKTECNQLRTLLHAYQEKAQTHQRLEDLHHQQQMRQELLKETQEVKVAAAVAPAQEEQHTSPRRHHPATRKRDTRSFHARSGWLVSSNASTALQASPDKSISWESIVETTDKYFQIADESSCVVRILQTGTYQLNLNVTHESSMELGVWIRSFDATLNAEKVRKLEPTLVQFYNNKQRVSRLDRVVELSRYDQVSVHLAEIGAMEIRTTWMAHFAPQPNMFFLTFLDQELVYKDAGK